MALSLLLTQKRKSYIAFPIEYLHLTLSYSKCQQRGQDLSHMDWNYLSYGEKCGHAVNNVNDIKLDVPWARYIVIFTRSSMRRLRSVSCAAMVKVSVMRLSIANISETQTCCISRYVSVIQLLFFIILLQDLIFDSFFILSIFTWNIMVR